MSFLSILIWILGWLPSWFFYIVWAAGMLAIMVSWFIWFIPLINRYRFPIQAIGVVVFGIGAFLSGGVGVNELWQARVAELEQKVKEAEEKSQQVNTEIRTVYVDKVKVVHDTQVVIQEKIKEVEKRIDADCKVDQSAIDLLDRAATPPGAKEKK